MNITELKVNPKNPRKIESDKFAKLVQSIKDFPEMMEKRPIVCVTDVDGKLYPLGGNMRLKAIKELGYKDIPDTWITLADDWTVEQRNEFVIKDNVGFGEWDWEMLQSDFDLSDLEDWGLDVPAFETDEDINFEPNLEPSTNYSDVTKEQIQKEAEKLATQMIKDRKKIECICPECGNEFEIDG